MVGGRELQTVLGGEVCRLYWSTGTGVRSVWTRPSLRGDTHRLLDWVHFIYLLALCV